MKTDALVLPHDPGWNEARLAWNLAVDQQPAAVALPESAEDVAAVVRWARKPGPESRPAGNWAQRRRAWARSRTPCS